MHQPSDTLRGVHGRCAFTHIRPLLQLFLQPQRTSSFQLTAIVGSKGNPSNLQVQNRVSNIWKVLLRHLDSFLPGAAEEGSMLCGSPRTFTNRCAVRIFPVPKDTLSSLTSRVTATVRANSWKHDRLETFLYCVGHMNPHSPEDFSTQVG